MSEFTVTVTPSETFPDNSNVTRAMLRNGATPQVSLSGTIGTSDISNGAVTDAKVAANAAIAGTKLGITQGALVAGGASNAGVILHPDTSVSGAFAAGGYDGENGNKRARFAVSRGTDPNEMGLLGTDISTAGGDIKIDVVNHRLKVEIEDGKVDARHIASAIGGQSSDSSADAYNATPTIGVSGSGVDTVLKVLDNSINAAQLANATNSEYYGGLFAFTSAGTCAQIKGGDVGQVLTARGNSNPTFQTLFTDINLGQPPGSHQSKRRKHGLTVTPTDIKFYLKCTATTASADSHWYNQNDIVYMIDQDDENASSGFADGTHIAFINHAPSSGTGGIRIKYRPFTTSDASNDGADAIQADVPSNRQSWNAIVASNWELHALVR